MRKVRTHRGGGGNVKARQARHISDEFAGIVFDAHLQFMKMSDDGRTQVF